MEFFRLIRLLTWGEPDKSGIMEQLCPTTRHFGSAINQETKLPRRNHSFRSTSLNAIVRSTNQNFRTNATLPPERLGSNEKLNLSLGVVPMKAS